MNNQLPINGSQPDTPLTDAVTGLNELADHARMMERDRAELLRICETYLNVPELEKFRERRAD
jgi:hypothetical protein